MKKLLFLITFLYALTANAQDFYITFAGEGASSEVSNVNVENLNSGKSLTISGTDILHLTSITTGLNSIENDPFSKIKIYPNPMSDYSSVQIYPPVKGDAVISVVDPTGKPVIQVKYYLENFRQEFRLSGVKNGLYLINVTGPSYHFSGKLLSTGKSNRAISIEKINNVLQTVDKKISKTERKGVQAVVDMNYKTGDRLKFTGTSGDFRTIMTDIPDKSKNLTFNLMDVTDIDNNIYHLVDIGDQVWMEENLKTTKYRDGQSIPLVTDNAQWSALNSAAYSWYNNDATYKDPYGALYNGFTVGTGKLCPAGWHVPSLEDWRALNDYLINNNFIYSGEYPGSIGKSLASKTLWNVPQPVYDGHGGVRNPSPATVGLNPQFNNGSGFNAFPGGSRGTDGLFTALGNSSVWETNWGTSTLTEFSLIYQSTGLAQSDNFRQAGFSVRCLKGEVKTLPTIMTTAAYDITQTSANVQISIPGIGESPITSRGVCWEEFDNASIEMPTISDYKTEDGNGTDPFISNMTGLKPGTFYLIRGYTVNNEGVSYGNSQTFTTDLGDADGNNYNTINLSDQIWTVENLKTTKLNDNTIIPLLSNEPSTAPGYSFYNNDPELFNTYGALYNWYAVNTNKLCPEDWHVATDDDWTSLTSYLQGNSVAGGRLKEAGTAHWLSPNTGAGSYSTGFDDGNDVHFEALPGGMRNTDATFVNITRSGMWWTSTQFDMPNAMNRQINYDSGSIIVSHSDKSQGLSVRCVKKVY